MMPLYLGALIQSISERLLNKFVLASDGFKDDEVFYTDTNSLYIEQKCNEKIWNSKNSVRDKIGRKRNDYGDGGKMLYDIYSNKSEKLSYL